MPKPRHAAAAFTLTESAAVLTATVMTAACATVALSGSRSAGRAAACATNERAIAAGIFQQTRDQQFFTPSYVFGADQTSGNWRIDDQLTSHPMPQNGHVHFSHWLLQDGYVADASVFSCPDALRGGAPNANPGPNPDDWDPGQLNLLGQPAPAALPDDRQAKRMAYTANHAIMPRNRFLTSTPRANQLVGSDAIRFGANTKDGPGSAGNSSNASGTASRLVSPGMIQQPAQTILLTEFAFMQDDPAGWRTLSPQSASQSIVSHRPITPFVGLTAGPDVYSEPNRPIPSFRYPSPNDIKPDDQLAPGEIDSPLTSLNAVGRHHPGGTAHFVNTDGSVILMTVRQTVEQRLWGERFYAISGDNRVLD